MLVSSFYEFWQIIEINDNIQNSLNKTLIFYKDLETIFHTVTLETIVFPALFIQ